MAKWLYTHRREIMLFCLLLILVAFVGHFLADATGFSLHSLATADLHGNFLPTLVAELATPPLVALPCLLPAVLFWYHAAPPTPPPPIPTLI